MSDFLSLYDCCEVEESESDTNLFKTINKDDVDYKLKFPGLNAYLGYKASGRNAISICIMTTFITLCLIHVHLTVLNFSLCFLVLV